jgi:hypothetical protein
MVNTHLLLKVAAKSIGLSEDILRYRLRSGQVKGHKLGRDWFVPMEEVERLEREYPVESRRS